MLTFTVHEPPKPAADRIERAEQLVFIKDGFSWVAMLLGPVWMLLHRLWWVLLAYLVLTGALQAAQKLFELNNDAVGLVMLAVNILVGFEADTLRRWSLNRKSWRMLGTVSGRSAEECERRFFDGWLPSQPIVAPSGDAGGGQARGKWPVIGSLLGAKT